MKTIKKLKYKKMPIGGLIEPLKKVGDAYNSALNIGGVMVGDALAGNNTYEGKETVEGIGNFIGSSGIPGGASIGATVNALSGLGAQMFGQDKDAELRGRINAQKQMAREQSSNGVLIGIKRSNQTGTTSGEGTSSPIATRFDMGGLTQEGGMLLGGKEIPLSENTNLLVGNKHEQGGIKDPMNQAEYEGGETKANLPDGDFIFSDSLMSSNGLTFADNDKALGLKEGKIENKMKKSTMKPENYREMNVQKRYGQQLGMLSKQREQLAQEQEMMKNPQMQQPQMMKYGGYTKMKKGGYSLFENGGDPKQVSISPNVKAQAVLTTNPTGQYIGTDGNKRYYKTASGQVTFIEGSNNGGGLGNYSDEQALDIMKNEYSSGMPIRRGWNENVHKQFDDWAKTQKKGYEYTQDPTADPVTPFGRKPEITKDPIPDTTKPIAEGEPDKPYTFDLPPNQKGQGVLPYLSGINALMRKAPEVPVQQTPEFKKLYLRNNLAELAEADRQSRNLTQTTVEGNTNQNTSNAVAGSLLSNKLGVVGNSEQNKVNFNVPELNKYETDRQQYNTTASNIDYNNNVQRVLATEQVKNNKQTAIAQMAQNAQGAIASKNAYNMDRWRAMNDAKLTGMVYGKDVQFEGDSKQANRNMQLNGMLGEVGAELKDIFTSKRKKELNRIVEGQKVNQNAADIINKGNQGFKGTFNADNRLNAAVDDLQYTKEGEAVKTEGIPLNDFNQGKLPYSPWYTGNSDIKIQGGIRKVEPENLPYTGTGTEEGVKLPWTEGMNLDEITSKFKKGGYKRKRFTF